MEGNVHLEPVQGMDHRDHLERSGTPEAPQFMSVCKCGAHSAVLPAAGMAHGWHAGHVEEVIKEMNQ